MLLHNLHIAWKSLKRNRTLSALIVTGIALGIALSTTFATVRHAFAQRSDPGEEPRPLLRAAGLAGTRRRPIPARTATRPSRRRSRTGTWPRS